MRSLIERHGGEPTVVASMQEVPLESNTAALEFGDRLIAGEIDVVIFLTGVGARAVLDAIASRHDGEQIVTAFASTVVIVRGPKPVAVLKDRGIAIDHRAAEPNTWREVMDVIDNADIPVRGKVVAVQEYGEPNQNLYDELSRRGATVDAVPVYCWSLPDDVEPLREAIRGIVDGRFDLVLFTSANQAKNVMAVADKDSLRDNLLAGAAKCLIASIGPTCSAQLVELGFSVGFEASPPKMGHLVRGAMSSV